MARISPLDGPIPGQSLTGELGNLPHEKPPQFTDVKKAMDFVFTRLIQPRNANRMLALMESGVPLTILVELLLRGGFGEGKWSAPMMFSMAPPLTVIMARMAEAAEIDYKISGDKKRITPELVNLTRSAVSSAETEKAVLAAQRIKSQGLMSQDG